MQSENLNLEENLMINEIPKTMLGKWKYFFYNLGMSKTIFCRHEGTCMKNCSFGGFKSFLLGFLIKFIINLLALIVSQKKARKKSLFI